MWWLSTSVLCLQRRTNDFWMRFNIPVVALMAVISNDDPCVSPMRPQASHKRLVLDVPKGKLQGIEIWRTEQQVRRTQLASLDM